MSKINSFNDLDVWQNADLLPRKYNNLQTIFQIWKTMD